MKMTIKKISDLTKDLSKDEVRKRIAQVGAVSLGVMLTLSGIPVDKACETYKEEKQRIEQQRIEEKNNQQQIEQLRIEEENARKEISLLSCKVLIENCPDGTVKHHFINKDYDERIRNEQEKYTERNYRYTATTDKNFILSYSEIIYNTASYFCYEEVPDTRGEYIFDYNVPYYMFDTTKLSLPEEYSLEELYSVYDLKELEERLDDAIYENKNIEQRYSPLFLFLAEVNGEYMCFDFSNASQEVTETLDKEDVTKLRNVYYVPSIGNDLINLKISSGESAIKDATTNFNSLRILDNYISGNFVIDDITSLDQTIRNDFRGSKLIPKNIYDYLTEEQFQNYNWNGMPKKEILEFLEKLNEKDYQPNRTK